MKLERKIYSTRREKVTDFIIGAVIFILLNGLIFGLSYLLERASSSNTFQNNQFLENLAALLYILNFCWPWVLNILAIVFFALTRHWIALGMVGIIAILFSLTMMAIVLSLVACFIAGGLG